MSTSSWRRNDRVFLGGVASRFAALFGNRFALPEGQWRDGSLQLFDEDSGGVGVLRAATPVAVRAGVLFSSKDSPRYATALQIVFSMGQVSKWRDGLDEMFRWVMDGLDGVGESVRAEAVATLAVMSRLPRIRCSSGAAMESIRKQLRDGRTETPEGASLVAVVPYFKAEFEISLQKWITLGLVEAVPRGDGIWTSADDNLAITWGGGIISSPTGPLPGAMFVGKDLSGFRTSLARLGLRVAEWRLSWYRGEVDTALYTSAEAEPLAHAMFRAGL